MRHRKAKVFTEFDFSILCPFFNFFLKNRLRLKNATRFFRSHLRKTPKVKKGPKTGPTKFHFPKTILFFVFWYFFVDHKKRPKHSFSSLRAYVENRGNGNRKVEKGTTKSGTSEGVLTRNDTTIFTLLVCRMRMQRLRKGTCLGTAKVAVVARGAIIG
jgi:hypothetical protein